MHNLGHTRSTNQRDHLLHTPDTFIRTSCRA
jgi:(S)-ureidoglycine aminohydrolase